MKAKVLAPAATRTEFGMVANDVSEYDYDKSFGTYHTSKQVAGLLKSPHSGGLSSALKRHLPKEQLPAAILLPAGSAGTHTGFPAICDPSDEIF